MMIEILSQRLLSILIDNHRTNLEVAFKNLLECYEPSEFHKEFNNFRATARYHVSLLSALEQMRKDNKNS